MAALGRFFILPPKLWNRPSSRMAKFKILSTRDETEWSRHLREMPRSEIVHGLRYTRIYERYGDGTAECAVFEDDSGLVLYPFLRRPIANSDGLSDIITPYGYGGPIWHCENGHAETRLSGAFRVAFEEYARDTRTISEFVRFHPYLQNHAPFIALMDDVTLHCRNVFVDLSRGADTLLETYRARFRTYIRKAEARGLAVEIGATRPMMEAFFDLYRVNMRRMHQSGYFNFRHDFMDIIQEELGSDLLGAVTKQDGEIVCAALFLKSSEDFLDYFLVAPNHARLEFRPNHLLVHRVAQWGAHNGFRELQLGGGHPSLVFFKSGFASHTRDYFVGKHVFDRTAYEKLAVDHWRRHGRVWTPDEPFFPGYRAEFDDD